VSVQISDVWRWLQAVPDPEIPVISIVDLGIVRGVEIANDAVVVSVTPTYSGCPATQVIAQDIRDAITARGIADVTVEQVLSPPWTTDWLTDAGREALREYGIAPPCGLAGAGGAPAGKPKLVPCPRCESTQTSEISRFGSTPCKAQYRCDACLEPFDYFKCY
jgi:ring-1,2-phenylacetyl-CoA epoxidase subunit PaaD